MTTVVHPGDSLTPRQKLVYVVVLGALTALGPFTIDLYLPAFPAVSAELGVSAAAIQLTLTATTIGFALGQLLVGPWSDKVGRRAPLIIATALHIAASIGVAYAPDVMWVGIFRVLQGIGAAGGGVVAMAMVRDLFGGLPLVRMLSRLALVSGLAPVLAPLIGSQLLLVLDWRGIFWFLAAYGVLAILAASFFLVETLPAERRADRGHSSVGERYRALFTDRVFVGVVLISGMTFSGLFAYLSSSSFLFQDVYGLNAQEYGLLFAVNSIGIVVGVQVSSRLAKYVGPQWILTGAVIGMIVSATTIVALDLANTGLVGILIPLFFFITSCGFAFPCQQVLALANHGGEAATAASVLGAVNFGFAGIISPIVGLFGIHDAIPMGGVMAILATVSLVVMVVLVRPRSVPALAR
ncbi:multidrug effflux MFS transporter [Conyzicola nivalis]|uniref:Bcr/CflA family drug resistance efflux transporter n=1 Tax=Conyzicola nivalis TaxID=1477021 RepID=A0A916SMT0_9MICO|nr:multidrug effflux MFS transporter [Conyzicola nivalis]GGB05126.1 Bcr/CflA family drug resistance efflux transporter [Conyzicola nivalis]